MKFEIVRKKDGTYTIISEDNQCWHEGIESKKSAKQLLVKYQTQSKVYGMLLITLNNVYIDATNAYNDEKLIKQMMKEIVDSL